MTYRYKGFECDTAEEAVALMRVMGDVPNRIVFSADQFVIHGNDGWIPWNGGERPVPSNAPVQTIERRETMDDFDAGVRTAKYCDWQHANRPWDITAYRVVSYDRI